MAVGQMNFFFNKKLSILKPSRAFQTCLQLFDWRLGHRFINFASEKQVKKTNIEFERSLDGHSLVGIMPSATKNTVGIS